MKQTLITKELQRIAESHGGLLRPLDVVTAARPAASPLHSHFEWDDSEAAEKYRLHQARQLINVVVQYIGQEDAGEPDRVFVSLRQDRKADGGGYRTLVSVMSDQQLREHLLADALAEMDTFQKKYQHLRELSRVFSEMKAVKRRRKAAA